MSLLKMKKTVLPKKTVNKTDQISSQFFEWTTKQMKCWEKEPEKEPQENAFKMICRGKMLEIAKFLNENIYSSETVFKASGCILLKEYAEATANILEDSSDSEMKSLQFKRKQLQKDTKIINAHIKHDENDIEKLKQNLQKKDNNLKESNEKGKCLRNKRRVFHLYWEYSLGRQDHYNSYLMNIKQTNNNSLRLKAKNVRQSNRSSSCFEPKKIPSEKKLGKIKKYIEKKISDFLEDKTKGEESYGNQTEKEIFPLIQKLLQLLDSYQIKDGFLRLYKCGNREVQVTTASVNIQEDAKNMWYRSEFEGKLVDEAKSQLTVKDVSDLLHKKHAENVKVFLKKHKTEQNNLKYLQEINDFERQIDMELKNLFAKNSEVITLIRNYISADLNAVGSEATFQYLLRLCSKYEQEFMKKCDDHIVLDVQLEDINYLNETAEINKNIVSVLFAETTTYLPQLLQSARLQNVLFVKEEILKSINMPDVNEMCSTSHLCIHDFQALDVNQLDIKSNIYTNQELAISIFPKPANFATSFLKSEETVLHESLVAEGKVCYNSCLTVLKEILSSQNLNKKVVVVHYIKDLIRLVKKHDRKQQGIASQLKSKLDELDAVINSCKALKGLMLDWLNQPAQFALPDYKIDGYNLKEWLERLGK